jgi:hypothetical protein
MNVFSVSSTIASTLLSEFEGIAFYWWNEMETPNSSGPAPTRTFTPASVHGIDGSCIESFNKSNLTPMHRCN